MSPMCLFYGINSGNISQLKTEKKGKNPIWQKELILDVENDPSCLIEILDFQEYGDHSLVGTGAFSIKNLTINRGKPFNINLFYKGMFVGEISFECEVTPIFLMK